MTAIDATDESGLMTGSVIDYDQSVGRVRRSADAVRAALSNRAGKRFVGRCHIVDHSGERQNDIAPLLASVTELIPAKRRDFFRLNLLPGRR